MSVDGQPALSGLLHNRLKYLGSHHFVDFKKTRTGLMNRRNIGACLIRGGIGDT